MADAPAVSRPRWRPSSRVFDQKILPWLLLAPALLLIFGLVLYPVGRTVWLSFRSAGLPYLAFGESRFVGLDNYRDLLTDAHLREVFLTTAVFGFACVAATMAAGLAVALLLDRPFRGRALLGVLVLLPWAVPRVAAGVVWRWMFDDQYGLVNWVAVAPRPRLHGVLLVQRPVAGLHRRRRRGGLAVVPVRGPVAAGRAAVDPARR